MDMATSLLMINTFVSNQNGILKRLDFVILQTMEHQFRALNWDFFTQQRLILVQLGINGPPSQNLSGIFLFQWLESGPGLTDFGLWTPGPNKTFWGWLFNEFLFNFSQWYVKEQILKMNFSYWECTRHPKTVQPFQNRPFSKVSISLWPNPTNPNPFQKETLDQFLNNFLRNGLIW